MKRICVFCGASSGRRRAYAEAADAIGSALVARGCGLVYGGGDHGLMGVVASAVRRGGGDVLGIIPQGLVEVELAGGPDLERAHADLRIVGSMHERKAQMEDAADAFCVLPGGVGTLEEVIEVLSWGLLALHRKPIGLLDVEGYYQPLLRLLGHQVEEGFLSPAYRALLRVESDPTRLIDDLLAATPAGPPPAPLLEPGER